jgi:putative glutamine amidotransferase
MPNLVTWLRAKDEKWFQPVFARYPRVKILNALTTEVVLEEMDGLLLTGGADVAPEFLEQEVPDLSVIERESDARRDPWEFSAVEYAVEREVPLFAICRGMQLLNVALGGTLTLDLPGHNLPEQQDDDVQELRTDAGARHRLTSVNSSHHQAVERVADRCLVEAWCAADDIIEQMRLRDYPFGMAVQYHPERGGRIYDALFDDFFAQVEAMKR